MKRTTIAAVLAAASAGIAAVAIAQPFGGPGYGPGGGFGPGYGGHGPGMMRGMGPGAWGDPATAAQTRLSALKTQLDITSAQQSAWQSYADAVTAQAAQMQQFRDQAASAATAVDRATLHANLLEQRAQGAKAVAEALQHLYAALTPDQRTLLDQHFAWRGAGRGPFGG